MPKKCPPGIICIENFTFLFFGILVLSILIFMYIKQSQSKNNTINNDPNNLSVYLKHNNSCHNNSCQNNACQKASTTDVLLNPYSAPLRDDRLFNRQYCGPKVPINVPTQSFDSNYRQIGILTRVNGGETILPLMGRPLFSNRDKWNFYTLNDKNNMIKLPITFKNKSCTNSQGCDNVYNGDTVYVEGYSDIFRVTVYDNNVMEYIPYL
mgnify:CR=1 FL=1